MGEKRSKNVPYLKPDDKWNFSNKLTFQRFCLKDDCLACLIAYFNISKAVCVLYILISYLSILLCKYMYVARLLHLIVYIYDLFCRTCFWGSISAWHNIAATKMHQIISSVWIILQNSASKSEKCVILGIIVLGPFFNGIHTQDFGFKKRMLLGQETIAPMSLSGSFSDLSWCHKSYEAPIWISIENCPISYSNCL